MHVCRVRGMDAEPPELGYRMAEHPADLALDLWGPDEPSLWRAGARALMEVLTEGAQVRPRARRELRLDAVDAEDRLVRWLNEVLWLATGEGFLVADGELTVTDGGLAGTVTGEPGAGHRLRAELKAVTYHDLRVERRPEGTYAARVVIDV